MVFNMREETVDNIIKKLVDGEVALSRPEGLELLGWIRATELCKIGLLNAQPLIAQGRKNNARPLCARAFLLTLINS